MNTANNANSSKSTTSATANLPANGPVTVNKLDNNKPKVGEEDDDEFKIADLNSEEKKINNMPAATNNTASTAASTTSSTTSTSKVLNTDIPEDLDTEMEDMDEPSSNTNKNSLAGNTDSKDAPKSNANNELKADEDSEFPVVSAESAVRNSTNRPENSTSRTENSTKPANNEPVLEDVKPLITPVNRTKKAHKRGAKSAVDLKTLKAAHLLVNQATGSVKVDTSDKPPTIVKLIQPVNKANIKLKTFKTKYEKEYEHMKKMSTEELLALKSKLESIEFDEVANTNIINGLLELVDDHHLKQLTIEKMLKMGDITINF